MKTIKAAVVMLVVTAALSSLARAQDFRSYYGQTLPNPANSVMSIANNVSGLQWAMSQKGKRVGGGQCTDLVTMAMNYSGARPGNFANYRNYIWGAYVGAQVFPGDIIQFEYCTFRGKVGNTTRTHTMDHHTAIVAGLSGTVVTLVHQNAGGTGPVVVEQLDLSWKTQGTIKFWRPVKW